MAFQAYGRNNRRGNFPRLPPGNFNRVDPPDILPEFRTSVNSMQSSYVAIRHEERERQVHQEIERRVRLEQERTEYGIKEVGLDDFDDDDDDVVTMAPVHSMLNPRLPPPPPPQQQIIYIVKEKKKKKKSKKRHRNKSTTDDDNDSDEGTSQPKRSRNETTEILTNFHSKNNPWKLLKKNEYAYAVTHLVVDPKYDFENLRYEQTYKHEVAEFNSVIKTDKKYRVISEKLKEFVADLPVLSFGNDERIFAIKFIRDWNIKPVERIFRNLTDNPPGDMIPISHQPCTEQDAMASTLTKVELQQEHLDNMTMIDYMHFKKSQENSYQESLATQHVSTQYSILSNKVLLNPHDVQSWLEFIDIQHAYHAEQESGSSQAPLKNKTAYYERVMEILRKAINANQSNVDLQIKKLVLMEGQYGANYIEVKNEWDRLQNLFVNSTKVWEFSIKRRMNNRNTFKVEDTLKHIDKCIDKLVKLKNRSMKSHKYLEESDEFLVDLLVTRCRLLISTGFIDRAIGMLQALAEFHFFRPSQLNELKSVEHEQKFEKFWESKVPRIGEEFPDGWANFYNEDEVDTEEWIQAEADVLAAENTTIRDAEKEEVDNYRSSGFSVIEARRRLERFRTRNYWAPVRHKHDQDIIYEYESRITKFEDIKQILFTIDDNLCQKLIYKLLHIFGVTVLDLDFTSQEDILRSFSPALFPSYRPKSLKLEKFSQFIENFIKQLAESTRADSARIYTALVTNISNSLSKDDDKIKGIKTLVTNAAKLKRYNVDITITVECQLALYITAFEELVRLKPGDKYSINLAWRILLVNLDDKNQTLWNLNSPNITNDEQQKLKRREQLFYLRFALFIARNLPFSDAETEKKETDDLKKVKREKNIPKTKREFLLSIWALGQVSMVPDTEETIKVARDRVTKFLKNGAPKDLASLEYRWIGNEHEIIFELAALFAYEFSFEVNGEYVNKYELFQKDVPIFTSQLAKSLNESHSPVPMEVRVHVLQHITHTCKGLEYTPGDLINFISKQVQQFPHSIPLLKAMLEYKNIFMQKRFLWINTGNDNLTRLIRDCGRLYKARVRLDADLETVTEEKEKEVKTIISRYVSIYRGIAERHSDNLIPDDYIWHTLIRTMVDSREKISFKPIDEVFILGQDVCPWSKAFLSEAVRGRPSDDDIHQTLNGSINKHGLNQYCTDDEIKILMTQNIV